MSVPPKRRPSPLRYRTPFLLPTGDLSLVTITAGGRVFTYRVENGERRIREDGRWIALSPADAERLDNPPRGAVLRQVVFRKGHWQLRAFDIATKGS